MDRIKRWWVDDKQDDGIETLAVLICFLGFLVVLFLTSAE